MKSYQAIETNSAEAAQLHRWHPHLPVNVVRNKRCRAAECPTTLAQKTTQKLSKHSFLQGKVWFGGPSFQEIPMSCSSLLFFVAFFTLSLHIDCQRLKSWKLGRMGSKDSNWDSHSSGLAVDMYSRQSQSRAEWLKPCYVIAIDLLQMSFLMLDHSASQVIHQSSRTVSKSGYPNISVHSTKGENDE